VLPLCEGTDTGTVVMMPLNQASKVSGLVGVPAALECVRRHIAVGNLPAEPPYTDPDLFDFLQPYPVPEAALRYVLAQQVSTCCVGFRTSDHLEANLRAVDPPYLDPDRLRQIQELFGAIQEQVR
jgi:aryl-alcohol dehydrogenase-like predicted oxidoreductase